jgi:cell shape-determining protein MreC
MKQLLVERLRQANLTGDILADIFSHLETIISESQSGQAALTLRYVTPTDDLQEGDLIPTINIVLTQYYKPEA